MSVNTSHPSMHTFASARNEALDHEQVNFRGFLVAHGFNRAVFVLEVPKVRPFLETPRVSVVCPRGLCSPYQGLNLVIEAQTRTSPNTFHQAAYGNRVMRAATAWRVGLFQIDPLCLATSRSEGPAPMWRTRIKRNGFNRPRNPVPGRGRANPCTFTEIPEALPQNPTFR